MSGGNAQFHLCAQLARMRFALLNHQHLFTPNVEIEIVGVAEHFAKRQLTLKAQRLWRLHHRLKLTPHMTPLQFLTESNRMWALGAAGFAVNRLLDLLAAQADEEPVT